MKLIVVQENLKAALSVCSRAIAASGSLAILGNVLLKTEQGMLRIVATNLEISISELVRCKVENEGVVCLSARLLNEVVAHLPNEPVTLEAAPDGLILSVGKYRTVLKTVSAEDFPVVSNELPQQHFDLPAKDMATALEGVLFSVSTNETQAELCGVYMAVKENELVLAGTDRYRLAESRVALLRAESVPRFSVIVPSRASGEVLRLLHNNAETVTVGITDSQAVFSMGEITVTTRLVDGQYPEYEAIVPRDFRVGITVGREDLAAALKAVAVFAKGSSGVAVLYKQDGSGLVVSARSSEAGEGVVEVAAEVAGESDTVLFNHKYVLDMLQFLTSSAVTIKLNNPASPVVFSDAGNPRYVYLVMPIKT